MLGTGGRVVLMDFGLVREGRFEYFPNGQNCRNPRGMSPEQCVGQRLDARSDIFSLGSTFYHLLTGQMPYRGQWQELIAQIAAGASVPPAHEVVPTVPMPLSEIASRAMAKQRDDRFADAQSMSKALAQAIKSLPIGESQKTDVQILERQPTVHPEMLPELKPLVERHLYRLPVIFKTIVGGSMSVSSLWCCYAWAW